MVLCDRGLKHLEHLQVPPSLIVVDVDSHDDPHLDAETIVLPCEKDDTDTVFAVKKAKKLMNPTSAQVGQKWDFYRRGYRLAYGKDDKSKRAKQNRWNPQVFDSRWTAL